MKINESRLKKIIAEEMAALEDKKYFDYTDEEGRMAKRQLEDIAQYASELAAMMDDKTQLEGWVQSKITLASDYISKVKHYLEDELGASHGGCKGAVPLEQPEDPIMVMNDDGEISYEITEDFDT